MLGGVRKLTVSSECLEADVAALNLVFVHPVLTLPSPSPAPRLEVVVLRPFLGMQERKYAVVKWDFFFFLMHTLKVPFWLQRSLRW